MESALRVNTLRHGTAYVERHATAREYIRPHQGSRDEAHIEQSAPREAAAQAVVSSARTQTGQRQIT